MSKLTKRLYAALIMLSDDNNIVDSTLTEIAEKAGYKTVGGMHTMAINWLIDNDYIDKCNGKYEIFL